MMKFITAQCAPTKEWKDSDGKLHTDACTFDKITVHVNTTLGFRPMWAIPVTTFKETLVSMLSVAPNYPQLCCIFDTDNYVRIDKIVYYKSLMDGGSKISVAKDSLPDYLTEYCLNIESLHPRPLIMGDVLAIERLRDGQVAFRSAVNVLASNFGDDIDRDLSETMNKYLQRFPILNADDLREQYRTAGFANIDIRVRLMQSWQVYQYTILPVILWAICDDTKNKNLDEGVYQFDIRAVESCMHNRNRLFQLNRDLALWSQQDCSLERFQEIRNQMMNCILDSMPVMNELYLGHRIERNGLCPCGSGQKFKKCHGRFL